MLNIAISVLRNSSGPILITGHTGFKGTWLTLLLKQLGIDVVGYSLPAIKDSMYQRLNREGAITEFFGDINNKEELEQFIKNTKPSFVMHLAAQPLVLESYRNPAKTFRTNVMGTINVIEAARASQNLKTIGIVTTDKVYRNQNSGKRFIESDPLQGKDPYSASKVATESVVFAWQNIQKIEGGPNLVSLRAGNVIGGGDFAKDRIVPDLIRGMISQEIVQIRNMDSTRPWQHVLDPLLGYLAAIARPAETATLSSFNFGPDESSYPVSKLLEIVQSNFPNRIKTKYIAGNSDRESKYLDLDSSLSKENLNWTPAWTQEQAIIDTFRWWVDVLEKDRCPFENSLANIERLLKFHEIEKI